MADKSPKFPTRSADCFSPLEAQRVSETPPTPNVLTSAPWKLELASGADADEMSAPLPEALSTAFASIAGLRPQCVVTGTAPPGAAAAASLGGDRPLHLGVASVSNAVAASGTHNVILGLHAFLGHRSLRGSTLWGIRHLTRGDEFQVDAFEHSSFLNQAGSDLLPAVPLSRLNDRMLGQMAKLRERLNLGGFVFLCGPSELPEVAKIAEYFAKSATPTVVVAVVHSLSGWVQMPGWIPTNLGFDSACSVLAEAAGNIALSRESLEFDIYHFVACGSSPLTIEVAMQIHPTLCFIGADVGKREMTLQAIIEEICDVIVERHHTHGLHSGVIMVSDDFFEQLVQMRQLQKALHVLRLEKPAEVRTEEGAVQLMPEDLAEFFTMLPADVRSALVFRTGMDGMPLLKPQEAERELGASVARCLAARGARGERSVRKFLHQPHSLRHLAWSPMPTSMDCALGYALGHAAGAIARCGANGYVASIRDTRPEPSQWCPCAVPMVRLLQPGQDAGAVAVRRRRLTADTPLCQLWFQVRDSWRFQHSCRQPGPAQFWGPGHARAADWAPYTTRVLHTAVDELAREAGAGSSEGKKFWVPLPRPFALVRRNTALLSPLQRWRCEFQPELPKVFRSKFRIAEEDRKGRVCADPALLHAGFPCLWRAEALKAIRIEAVPDEVSVLHMLPERPPQLPQLPSRTWTGSMGSMAGYPEVPSPTAAMRLKADPETAPSVRSSSGQNLVGMSEVCSDTRIGIAVLGKPGPGVNNVIHGLFDYLNLPERSLPGVLVCFALGIAGLTEGYAFDLDAETFAPYRNQGGCELLGQSEPGDLRDSPDDHVKCAEVARRYNLDGLVIWGGRKVHVWTAKLAEYFLEQQLPTRVVGVPASTQSDLPLVEQTLGYDSVCKLYASIVGNLSTQAASSGKLWCFVRIPGRSMSHIAAEVALETHPHCVLMASEMEQSKRVGVMEVTQMICNVIEARSQKDKHYGVVLIPDQFLASVREMRRLFEEIDQILALCPEAGELGLAHDFGPVLGLLPPLSRAMFQSFPERAKAQIISVIRSSGSQKGEESLDLSTVETEVIFQALVEAELTRRVVLGTYKGTFRGITYSLPYHGRAAMPTNFDCDFGYTCGYTAGVFVDAQHTGVLVDVRKLKEDTADWEVGGTPLPSLLTFPDSAVAGERTSYHIEPKRRLHYDVGLDEGGFMPPPATRTLVNPGPAQFAGPCAGQKTETLRMPQLQRVRQMERTEQLIAELKAKASAGCPPEVLQAVKLLLEGGTGLMRQL